MDSTKARLAAEQVREAVERIVYLLALRWSSSGAGKHTAFLIDNLLDPTDDMGTIPAGLSGGLCAWLKDPRFAAGWMQVRTNLAYLNGALSTEASRHDNTFLVDPYRPFARSSVRPFLGHGANGGTQQWRDKGCFHPLEPGHHQIRQQPWKGAGVLCVKTETSHVRFLNRTIEEGR